MNSRTERSGKDEITVRVWEGYVSPRDTRVTFITFGGYRIGGTAYTADGAIVEFTFYRTVNGRVVVHEARLGHWGAGFPYDRAFVRVFHSLDEACTRLNIDKQHIDPHRRNTNARRVNAPDAPVLTLDEWARGAGTY